MCIATRIGNGIGMLALAASFALASPGVTVVHAESIASPDVSAQCEAAERKHDKDAEIAAFLEKLRSEQPRRVAREHPEIVMLNNRGYNYGQPSVELNEILAEIHSRP